MGKVQKNLAYPAKEFEFYNVIHHINKVKNENNKIIPIDALKKHLT